MCRGSKYEKERPSGKEWNYFFDNLNLKNQSHNFTPTF
jgi:hypothetical protein